MISVKRAALNRVGFVSESAIQEASASPKPVIEAFVADLNRERDFGGVVTFSALPDPGEVAFVVVKGVRVKNFLRCAVKGVFAQPKSLNHDGIEDWTYRIKIFDGTVLDVADKFGDKIAAGGFTSYGLKEGDKYDISARTGMWRMEGVPSRGDAFSISVIVVWEGVPNPS